METYIFVTIFVIVSSFTISNSFHLKRVKRIIENIPEDLHPSAELFKNQSDISSVNTLYENNLSESFVVHPNETSTQSSLEKQDVHTSNTGHIEKTSNNKTAKICDKHIWTSNRYKSPEKPGNMRNPTSHPKREPVSHPMWHKNFKDWHKLGAVNNAPENNLNRIDVVVVDIQPIHAILPEKQRLYTHNSPSVHYVPVNPTSSIFDIFFGLNPFSTVSTEFLTEPVAVENDFYFQDRVFSSPWNRRPSFAGILKPDLFHQEVNGYNDRKDVNVAQLVGQTSKVKNCTCAGRN